MTGLEVFVNKDCFPFHFQQKCQEEQQKIIQVYLRSSKKEHKQMLERKAVIEARKEYLESLHVKRVSPLFFCFCFFLTCFLSLFETFLITFILDANLSVIHFMFNSQRKHSCFPQEVQ